MRLLSPECVCYKILKANSRKLKKHGFLGRPIPEKFGTFEFPIFTAKELKDLKRTLINSSQPFRTVLSAHNYVFDADFSVLVQLTEDATHWKFFPIFYAQYLLNAYLSWCMSADNLKDAEQIVIMLNIMNFVLRLGQNVKHKHLLNLISNAFVIATRIFMQSPAAVHIHSLLPALCMFFALNEFVPLDHYKILVDVADRTISRPDLSDVQIEHDFFSICDAIVVKMKDRFPVELLGKILEKAMRSIRALDDYALTLLEHSVERMNACDVENFMQLISGSIFREIVDHERVNRVPDVKEEPLKLVWQNPKFSHLFLDESDLDGKELHLDVQFPGQIPLEEMIRSDLYPKVVALSRIIHASSEGIKIFCKNCLPYLLRSEEAEHSFDMNVVVIEIFRLITAGTSDRSFIEKSLFSSCILDPRFTVFRKGDEEFWIKISSIRSYLFAMLSPTHIELLKHVLATVVKTPLLYGEVLYRLEGLLMQEPDDDLFVPGILEPLMFYQSLPHDPDITTARIAAVEMLEKVLSLDKYLEALFSDDNFRQFYLSLLFEIPLRPLVLQSIVRYFCMITDESGADKSVMEAINLVASTVLLSISDIRSIPFMIGMVDAFNRVLELRPHLADWVYPLAREIWSHIRAVHPCDEAKTLIKVSIQMFILLGATVTISEDEIESIVTAIRNVCGAEPGAEISDRLTSLMVVESEILHAKAAKIILQAFSKSRSLCHCFEHLTGLCRSSQRNGLSLHKADIDLFILGMIMDWCAEGTQDQKTVEAALDCFQLISDVECSFAVVQKFVQLLCPIDALYFSNYHTLIIGKLHEIILQSSKVPRAWLPILPKSSVIVNIPSAPNDLCFTVWFRTDTDNPQYKYSLVAFSDGTRGLSVQIRGNVIHIRNFASHDLVCEYIVTEPLRLGEWFLLTFAVMGEYINYFCGKTGKFLVPLKYGFSRTNLTVRYNTVIDLGGITLVNCAKIGRFSLFGTLDSRSLAKIVASGVNGDLPPSLTPIFHFVPTLSGKTFNLYSQTNVQYTCELKQVDRFRTFAEVLFKYCHFEILLPLLAQVDIKYRDGFEIKDYALLIVQLIADGLRISEEARSGFQDHEYMKVIAHILIRSQPIHLSYKLYMLFFTIFRQTQEVELKKQIFRDILMNYELWTACNPVDQLKILRHQKKMLSKKLLSEHFDLYLNEFGCHRFMNVLRVYYWMTKSEGHIIPHVEGLNVRKCRNCILNIVRKLLSSCSDDDIAAIVEQAAKVHDVEQLMDVLELLTYTAKLRTVHNVSVCQNRLTKTNPKLSYMIIRLLCIAGHINELLEPIMGKFSNELRDKSLMSMLLKLVDQYPVLLNLCAWIAVNTSERAVRSILKKVKPSPMYPSDDLWMVVMVFHTKSMRLKTRLIRWLIVSREASLIVLYQQIRIVGQSFYDRDTRDKHLRLFLTELCESDLVHKESSMDTIRILLQQFFFFQNTKDFNKALRRSFKESPFADCLDADRVNINVTYYFTGPKVLSQIIGPRLTADQYCFGLRLSENADWDDLELAEKAILLLKNPKHLDLSAALCHFLTRENRVVPCEVVKNIKENTIFPFLIEAQIDRTEKQAFDDSFKFFEAMKIPVPSERIRVPLYTLCLDEPDIKSVSFASFIAERKHEKKRRSQAWNRLWRSITTQKGPWYKSLPPESRNEPHYMRDDRCCFAFCPFKTKRNFAFDDHQFASFTRDFGSFEKAQISVERCNLERTNSQHLQLLQVREEATPKDSEPLLSSRSRESKAKKFWSKCDLVRVVETTPIDVKLFPDELQLLTPAESSADKILRFDNIESVMQRSFLHRHTAVEIFMKDRKSYFINFSSEENMISFINAMKKVVSDKIVQHLPFHEYFKEKDFTTQWAQGKRSNFEYLMLLNVYSGRSFNVPSQYPIFPWVIGDYSTETIDLDDESTFRDLSVPIGAIDQKRLADLRRRKAELDDLDSGGYLYASGPVCPLAVYLWLIRLEPFTSLHIAIQGGKFDHSARIFQSIEHSYRLSLSYVNDFRELIPEFYFSPEFLVNANRFDLGKIKEETVDNVILPKWAPNAIEFVYLHRKALESDYVSQHLNEWIDLLWGVRQKDDINKYKKEMYADIWDNLKDDEDEFRIEEIEAVLSQVGQIPPQMFFTPHRKREPRKDPESSLAVDVFLNLKLSDVSAAHLTLKKDSKLITSVVNSSGTWTTTTIELASVYELSKRTRSRSMTMRPSTAAMAGMDHIMEIKATQELPAVTRAIDRWNDIQHNRVSIQFVDGSRFLALGKFANAIYSVRGETRQAACDVTATSFDIVSILYKEGWFVVAGSDTTIRVFGNDVFRAVHEIRSFCDSIQCIDLSTRFDELVCVSKEGSMIMCSLNRGFITRVVETNESPLSVLITPAWGFVIISSETGKVGRYKGRLSLYTINGLFVRSVEITDPVSCWTSYSRNGFDYVLLADTKGKLFHFEAFYLAVGRPCFRFGTTSEVLELTYNEKDSTLFAVTSNGRLNFIRVAPVPLKI